MQAGQTLYMLDFAGPPGFAQAAAQTGARWASPTLHSVSLICSPSHEEPITTTNRHFSCREQLRADSVPNKHAVLRVIVLDHHKTAIDMLAASESQYPTLDLQLDINRSGATIARDYFKPEVNIPFCAADHTS